ncbi:MAG: hypothetical protein WKF90_12555 [Pyrinomonadaceae bacterium]
MKNTFLKTIGGAALTILMLTMFAQVRVSAQDTNKDQSNEQTQEDLFGRRGNELEGTWDVQVTVRNCQTGVAIRTYPELQTFMFGGTMLASTSGIPPSRVTPGQGVWSHAGRNTYRFKFKDFNFDANGNFTGWVIIKHEVNLAFSRIISQQRTDKFESAGTAEVYSPNGNLLFTGCATETATRFE